MSLTPALTFPDLTAHFTKCVQGYHLVNDDPIKEAPWEDINAQILLAAGCTVDSTSKGSHKSGADVSCSLGSFSNKSTQYDATGATAKPPSFKISSYRLTSVCSDKAPGTVEEVIAEIQKRKNFSHYSIIVRDSKEDAAEIHYDWYLIPADFPALNPTAYTWSPKIGKVGKNKGVQTGWETNVVNGSSMAITFSMSSQLWMDVQVTPELKEHLVASCSAKKGRQLNYIQLYEMLTAVKRP